MMPFISNIKSVYSKYKKKFKKNMSTKFNFNMKQIEFDFDIFSLYTCHVIFWFCVIILNKFVYIDNYEISKFIK